MPLLETGGYLSRQEFERRYAAMPDLKKAELIEGVVYMPARVLSVVQQGIAAESHQQFRRGLGRSQIGLMR
jgi:hypothetical protein